MFVYVSLDVGKNDAYKSEEVGAREQAGGMSERAGRKGEVAAGDGGPFVVEWAFSSAEWALGGNCGTGSSICVEAVVRSETYLQLKA